MELISSLQALILMWYDKLFPIFHLLLQTDIFVHVIRTLLNEH